MHMKKENICAECDAFQKCQTYNLQSTWHLLNIQVTMSETEQLSNSSAIWS